MKKTILTLISISILCLSLTGCKSSDYKKAVEFQTAGDYSSAVEIFKGLDDYKDSADRAENCTAMIDAINKFETAKSNTEAKNADLDKAISEAGTLVTEENPALDDSLLPTLETAISEAKAVRIEVPSLPNSADEILSAVASLEAIDYSNEIKNISDKKSALERSIKQYALVNAPQESYIISCLKKVETVKDISAATEDNDPNGNLNKAGGYTAQVYFSTTLIDQSEIFGDSIIEKGTDCGGSIEVYANVDDANRRNDYLAALDGGILASGSHMVIGTVVVRTSDELTASKQKELEANIIAALTDISE